MKTIKKHRSFTTTFYLSILITLLTGCSGGGKPKLDEKFLPPVPSARKFAPEPVYFRLKTAYPPSPIPQVDSSSTTDAVPILPNIKVNFKNEPLKSVGKKIGKMLNYEVYCASPILSIPITLKKSGSVEEILQEISKDKGIITSVNHEDMMIQFLVGIHPE